MGKRLGIGLLKGLFIGAAIGSAVTFGLRWPTPSGSLLAYLFALGAGGTTGIFAGKAPWKDGAWLEAVLKGLVGVMCAALVYWLVSTYAAFGVPWPGWEQREQWTSLPPLFLAAVAGVYGALVELDHDDEEKKKPAAKPASKPASTPPVPKARVAAIDDTSGAAETKAARKRI